MGDPFKEGAEDSIQSLKKILRDWPKNPFLERLKEDNMSDSKQITPGIINEFIKEGTNPEIMNLKPDKKSFDIKALAGCLKENLKQDEECSTHITFENKGKVVEELNVGVKFDNNKPTMSYIPYEALEEIAKVLDYGAIKYSPWNWKKGISFNRLLSASMRHIGQYNSGQDIDDETKISHLAHAACNLMFLLYFEKHREDLDDRGFKK